MTIKKIENGDCTTLALEGRLDTTSAPEFEKEIDAVADSNAHDLIIDLKELAYTSSAGLRVILKAQKLMSKKGSIKLINVNEDIMEVFDITGFLDILTIE